VTTGVTAVEVVVVVAMAAVVGVVPATLEVGIVVVTVVGIGTVASSATNLDISPGTAGKLTGATNVIKSVILLGTVRSQALVVVVMVAATVVDVEIIIQILHVTIVTRRVTSHVNVPNPLTGNPRVVTHVANQVT
jgi:hypothetical protein